MVLDILNMQLNILSLVICFSIFSWIFSHVHHVHAQALAQGKNFAFKLPLNHTQNFEFNRDPIQNKNLEIYFESAFFQQAEGLLWLQSLEKLLNEGYKTYQKLYETGSLETCVKPSSSMPRLTLFLVNKLNLKEFHLDRRGYYHPNNPGPVIETQNWDDPNIKSLILHEATHFWCQHSPDHNEINNWQEEGAAQYIAYATTGVIPQLQITRYFQDPCNQNLYGSSFLWWLALAQKNGNSFLSSLASLHLGLRPDLFHGALKENIKCDETTLPYGEIQTNNLQSDLKNIFFEIKPWGEKQISTKPTQNFFQWTGPL